MLSCRHGDSVIANYFLSALSFLASVALNMVVHFPSISSCQNLFLKFQFKCSLLQEVFPDFSLEPKNIFFFFFFLIWLWSSHLTSLRLQTGLTIPLRAVGRNRSCVSRQKHSAWHTAGAPRVVDVIPLWLYAENENKSLKWNLEDTLNVYPLRLVKLIVLDPHKDCQTIEQ